jgi:hypothetical protein
MSNYREYYTNIFNSGLSIQDKIDSNDEKWIPTNTLEKILNSQLIGFSLKDLPIRTRSKVLKSKICEILGYPIPKSFKKTQPRFYGQSFDTYIQKSNNLQIWNEEISATRRYVIIKLSNDDIVTKIRVVPGNLLAELDKTGTLTQKYQAKVIVGENSTELLSLEDTDNLKKLFRFNDSITIFKTSPIQAPISEEVLTIKELFNRLKNIVGLSFPDIGIVQERNRGAALHEIVCKKLGYTLYQDDGQFPDIKNQLIEVKLQTSPTIDLGLVSPDSKEVIGNLYIRHCDVRYAIFYGRTDGKSVQITHFYLTTGEKFFLRFKKFEGRIVNRKIQIPLPKDFFDI